MKKSMLAEFADLKWNLPPKPITKIRVVKLKKQNKRVRIKKYLCPVDPIRDWAARNMRLELFIREHCKGSYKILDLSNAIKKRKDETGVSCSKIGFEIGLSSSMVSVYLCLQKLHPDIKRLLDLPTPQCDRVSVIIGCTLSRIQPNHQSHVWYAAKKAGTEVKIIANIKFLGKDLLTKFKTNMNSSRLVHNWKSRKLSSLFSSFIYSTERLVSVQSEDLEAYVEALGSENCQKMLGAFEQAEKNLKRVIKDLSKVISNTVNR